MVFIIYQTNKEYGFNCGKARVYQANAYYTAVNAFKNSDVLYIQFEKVQNNERISFKMYKTQSKGVIQMRTNNDRTHFLSDKNDKELAKVASTFYRISGQLQGGKGTKKMKSNKAAKRPNKRKMTSSRARKTKRSR